MRRSGDLVIFVPTTTTTDIQTDYFTPAAHARGVNNTGYTILLNPKAPEANGVMILKVWSKAHVA